MSIVSANNATTFGGAPTGTGPVAFNPNNL